MVFHPTIPNKSIIEKYSNNYINDSRYFDAYNTISHYIKQFPQNNDLEVVLIKVILINQLYSTRLFSVYRMAQYIHSLSIDNLLMKGDESAVELLTTGHGIKKKNHDIDLRFYSFATKYCSFHNSNFFPIFDTNVKNSLLYFKSLGALKFETKDLKKYQSFKNIIVNFQKQFNLETCSLVEIDRFLWQFDKEKDYNLVNI